MPRAKWSIGDDEPDDLEPFSVYDGPLPPAGVYHVALKRLNLAENRNGEDMLKILVEIRDGRAEKKQYNGCGVWANQNVTEQGAPFVKSFLTSFGWTWSEFMNKTILESADERPTAVIGIGKVKIEKEPMGRVQLKRATYQGDAKVEVAQWLPPVEDEGDEPAWDADDQGGSAPDDDDPFA
jgi:hypothetical protein